MKKKKFLSICIPTYNRSDFLIKTLEKIRSFKEARDIEVVVADDASTDSTYEMVQKFIKKHKNFDLKYKKFSKRQYFDKMVISIVKMASGKYCWLISDDDIPLPGSISKIKSIVNNNSEVSFIHMNYVRFDNLLKKITSKRMVGSIKKDVRFNDADDFFFKQIGSSYFKYLGTNIITMSTDVFDREKWLRVTKNLNKYIGYNFIHCFAICTLIRKFPNIFYIGKPSIRYLSNNHRVWPNDIWKDYNTIFLDYLLTIGYSKEKIIQMRKTQKQYEKREEIMKNPILKNFYLIARPLYARLQIITNFLNGR